MKHQQRFVFLALMLIGCEPAGPSAKQEPPATVAKVADESELNTVRLSPAAEERLGIRTMKLKRGSVPRERILAGEVIVPPGQSIVVSAPFPGTVSAPSGGTWPSVGQHVVRGKPLLDFVPLLTPERQVLTPSERVRFAEAQSALSTAQITAKRDVDTAQIHVQAAQIALKRAKQLLEDQAGSQRTVDEADAQLRLAKETLESAEERHELVMQMTLEAEEGTLSTRSLKAPLTGTLLRLDVALGETVTTGEILFEVVRSRLVWLRVPVYAGEWRNVRATAPAVTRQFGYRADDPGMLAVHVDAPPSANALAATVDLYYQLDNPRDELRPGQKLLVWVPLAGSNRRLVVARSAVVYDVQGGTWVYEQVAPHTYARRRVELDSVTETRAVLARGPKVGAPIVAEGATELFGTEFGFGSK